LPRRVERQTPHRDVGEVVVDGGTVDDRASQTWPVFVKKTVPDCFG